MVVLAVDRRARALRVPPTRARHITPPARVIAQRHLGLGAHEHHGAGHQQAVVGARRAGRQLHLQVFPFGFLLGRRDIAGGFHEAAKLRIGDVVDVHPEPAYRHLVRGHFIGLRQLVAAAHQELAPRHPRHARRPTLAVAQHHLDGLRFAVIGHHQKRRAGRYPQHHAAQQQRANQAGFVFHLLRRHIESSEVKEILPAAQEGQVRSLQV
ncbi:hypothetical protein D3C86_1044710 [compost metagenome]